MSGIPKRVKSSNEKVDSSQAALRSEITSDPKSTAQEEAYLHTLKLKVDLGLLDPAQLSGLYPSDSPEEVLTRNILRNLSGLGSLSPEMAMIQQQFGETNRLALAQKIAARMVKSAQMRNVTAKVLGVGNDSINGFGQDVVDANMNNAMQTNDPMQTRTSGSCESCKK